MVDLRAIHEARAHAQGGGRAPHPRGQPETLLAQLFYFGGFFWSRKNHKKIGSSIGLRLIFLFCKTLKQEKTQNWHWSLG